MAGCGRSQLHNCLKLSVSELMDRSAATTTTTDVLDVWIAWRWRLSEINKKTHRQINQCKYTFLSNDDSANLGASAVPNAHTDTSWCFILLLDNESCRFRTWNASPLRFVNNAVQHAGASLDICQLGELVKTVFFFKSTRCIEYIPFIYVYIYIVCLRVFNKLLHVSVFCMYTYASIDRLYINTLN